MTRGARGTAIVSVNDRAVLPRVLADVNGLRAIRGCRGARQQRGQQ